MIRLTNLSLQRGGKTLFAGIDLSLHAGQRVGLVGANGSGKTSLFQLLLGQLESDAGVFELGGQTRIAHMAQEIATGNRAALEFVLDGDAPLRAAEQAVQQAQASNDDQALVKAYGELETVGAHEATHKAQRLLSGLGFAAEDQRRPVGEFSGGWRMRLNLARALMAPSDLLLLDEPTNHLDLDTMLWLEQWLKNYAGALLLISHDRDFLDAVVTHIAHIDRHQIKLYTGGYSAFEQQRAQQLLLQQAAYAKQQQQIGDIQRFVARFGAKASKAKQAQSRLKTLARMEVLAAIAVESPFSFRFPVADKTSDPLLRLRNADLGYGTRVLLRAVDLSLGPGSRIGLLGRNGAGKSTLIKTLAGQLSLLAGERNDGAHLRIGYFAQHQLEALDLNASPLLHLQRLSPQASQQQLRTYLGSFDFVGDQALGGIRHFSGGEKARLALAILAWQKPNLILLDEPTNHLDIEVRNALALALQQYEGAVVLVSHDRHLLRTSVDEFLLVDGGKVSSFAGDLDDYQAWFAQAGKAPESATNTGKAERSDKKAQRREAAAQREQLKPLKQKIAGLERELGEQNQLLQGLDASLAEPELYQTENKTELQSLLSRQAGLKQRIEALEQEWLLLGEELEARQAALASA